MSSKSSIILMLVILILIALALGYTIYNQQPTKKTTPTQTQTQTQQTSQQPPRGVSPSSQNQQQKTLTTDEQAALKTPGQNATEEERRIHFDAAQKVAKYANTLDIGQCMGNPIVIQVQQKQKLTINNPDSVDHNIVIDTDHQYLISANSKKEIVIDFGKGGGLYGYGCDDITVTRGLFLVGQ